jgi:hypothetical protein
MNEKKRKSKISITLNNLLIDDKGELIIDKDYFLRILDILSE